MRYLSETTDFQLKNSVVTLGKFDGLHIGHHMLLDHVIELKANGYESVMFTFNLHPRNLFSETDMRLIYTNEEKLVKLKEMGIDVLIAYPFTKETANLEPEDFIEQVLVNKLDAKVLVVGSDYGFGKGRRGNVQMLYKYQEQFGYKVYCYDKITYKDEVVSSTRIRDEILKGNMEDVTVMLGRPYSLIGEVLHGRKLGRTLGIPTINLIPSDLKLLPPNGVYMSKTKVDGVCYQSVTNIGYKPTVGGENKPGVETFLLDFDEDLYGKTIEVELYRYHRPEMKFESIEKLKEQMEQDIAATRLYYSSITENVLG